jgi:hypothetical protein
VGRKALNTRAQDATWFGANGSTSRRLAGEALGPSQPPHYLVGRRRDLRKHTGDFADSSLQIKLLVHDSLKGKAFHYCQYDRGAFWRPELPCEISPMPLIGRCDLTAIEVAVTCFG